MDRSRLIEKALEYKNAKPWKELDQNRFFALRQHGQLCLVHLVKMEDGSHTLIVYPGEKSIGALRRMMAMAADEPHEAFVSMLETENLQCQLGRKSELSEDQQADVAAFAKARGISLRGLNAWPAFLQLHRLQAPVPTERGSTAEELLFEALDAAIWLAEKVRGEGAKIPELTTGSERIPLIRREKEGWTVEETALPEVQKTEYPAGFSKNEMLKARARRLKKKGRWACELRLLPTAVKAEGVDGLHYPWELLTVNLDSGKAVEVQPVRDYERRADVMLDKWMEALTRENGRPAVLTVSDQRTFAFMKDWCGESETRLVLGEKPGELAALEPGRESDMDSIEDMEYMLEIIAELPDELLKSDPALLRQQAFYMGKMAAELNVPASLHEKTVRLAERLNALLEESEHKAGRKAGKGRKKPDKPHQTYVISVSLESGCYRHIRISGGALLEDLSEAILDAFGFVDDHAHAFFMDNRAYSRADAYYSPGMDGRRRSTDHITVEETGMQPGQKFKYLFDFGEDWTFQCRLLRITDERTDFPEAIRSVGTAPEQYPDWDWDYDWDEDDDDWDDDE